MDFEKIKTDFQKRYDRKCENIYFAGKCITLFSKNATTLSGCVSLGEAMATARREDGRITVQFSGTDSMITFNVNELKRYRDQRAARLLIDAQNCGITPGGADIFVYKNSRITDLLEPLLLGGLSAFSKDVPQKERLLPRFENYAENLNTLSGRRRAITLFDGQRINHLDFFGGKCKVVISYAGEGGILGMRPKNSSTDDALLALKASDMEKFGALLEKDTRSILKEGKCEVAGGIFLAASKTKDALGSGIIDDRGIFSLVENNKIDGFVHNVSAMYKRYFGGVPDFYVTDFVDSGFFATIN